MPSLSVVVPIYNVSDYLGACLESLASQTLEEMEVVLVDDGSTDNSGEIAASFASARENWHLITVENGGLGRARNIGFDHSTAEYVTFVDSDDLIPRDAHELMLHAVSESGSDLVCGAVLRFDGATTFPSPLHRRAILRTQMRTHISQSPELIYDTTAWNKVYRRSFLLEHGLRFPEGVYYEDIPLTLPAHFLARSVDVLTDTVYLWRERQTAVQSITQRRTEVKNLADRMAAVSSVNDFLLGRRDDAGKKLHDLKVLTVDIPLFLEVFHEGSDEFRGAVISLVGKFLDTVAPSTLAKVPPLRRLQYHLIGRGMSAELLELQDYYRVPANRGHFVRQGVRLYADLPFRTDKSKAVPASVYEVTRSQPLRTGVRDVGWRGDALVVDGHAFIHRVPEATPTSSIRRFQLRRLDAPGRPQRVRARRVRRRDLTARTVGMPVSYDAAGFRATIPASQLLLPPGTDSARFELVAQVAAPSARRGSSVGNPELGAGRHPRRCLVAPDQLALPKFEDRRFVVAVERVDALLESVVVEGDGVRFTLRSTTGGWDQHAALFLRRTDALRGRVVPLRLEGEHATAVVSAHDLEVHSTSFSQREWIIGLTRSEAPADSEPQRLVHLAPDSEDMFLVLRGRSLEVRESAAGGATILDTRPGPVLTSFAWAGDGLHVEGDLGGAVIDSLTLTAPSGDRHVLPVSVDGDSWSATLPGHAEPGLPSLRALEDGLWTWTVTTDELGERERVVRTSSTAQALFGDAGAVDGLTYLLRAGDAHELLLSVDALGDYRDRGALHRQRNRRYWYRLQQRMPLEDTIFFESWRGRQCSDNPRAIYEELQRQGDPRRCVWAVQDLSVEVPEGATRVVTGSRDYYRHLARSRWVISNDSMPVHYVKRPGTRYAQTWHGTPLKRIGFDIENLQMANKNYLKQFAHEVTKWDALVSPNAFSTEILRRAFRYDGEVLEIGYPRNDIFHRPELAQGKAKLVRARLGIPEDKRVILYAPTWRDNDYDATGQYQFTMKLDLERLHQEFRDDSVLLIRGHQLVASAIDASMFGGFALNVSRYPDIRDLYLVADVLVTDYSSVMFDFVNTGRPILFFTWDLEDYRDNLRGFYFDFEQDAPGPLIAESAGIIDALHHLDEVRDRYADRYAVFREKYAGLEDGHASARMIRQFL